VATKEIQIAQLVWQTRRLFQRMASESNDLLSKFGINASHRAVLQFLDHKEPETLANMARAQDVSRQHIQQIVNELLAQGLVESIENPDHKRSFLVRRTNSGETLFANIAEMESVLFKTIGKEFSRTDLHTAVETLKTFNSYLHSTAWSDVKKNYS